MTPTLVRELMTVGVATCKTSTPIQEVASFLIEHNLEEMVVLNADGEGVGVCGYNELVGVYGREDLANLTAENVMREGVTELPADIPIAAAAQMMKDMGVRAAYMNHNAAGITYPAAFI
jgi:CBS domain-containing protein